MDVFKVRNVNLPLIEAGFRDLYEIWSDKGMQIVIGTRRAFDRLIISRMLEGNCSVACSCFIK